jgi:hypothetical protein
MRADNNNPLFINFMFFLPFLAIHFFEIAFSSHIAGIIL